jgi:hypothetical protein
MAELAWPEQRVAIVLATDPEREAGDRAYADAGWQARTARQWTAAELAQELVG